MSRTNRPARVPADTINTPRDDQWQGDTGGAVGDAIVDDVELPVEDALEQGRNAVTDDPGAGEESAELSRGMHPAEASEADEIDQRREVGYGDEREPS